MWRMVVWEESVGDWGPGVPTRVGVNPSSTAAPTSAIGPVPMAIVRLTHSSLLQVALILSERLCRW